MSNRVQRIGITMRETQAEGYHEPRDSIARDWSSFMAVALPEVQWLPIPNLGRQVVDFCTAWNLDGLILSGGEDVGLSPIRDETERSLIRHFTDARLPVLGICRGLQLLWVVHGGTLEHVDNHVGTRHPISFTAGTWQEEFGAASFQTNSYHANGLGSPSPGELEVLALAGDGSIEAAWNPNERILGMMWHPEREHPPSGVDTALVRWLFSGTGQ